MKTTNPKDTHWPTGAPIFTEKEMRDLHNSAQRLAIALSVIVDCGGIGAEDMYDEARDALRQYNDL
jgi:hypothetical protein